MLFARLLRQASPVPEGLASLNAQAEAANHEQSLPRTHPGLREISPSFPVSDADLKTFVDDFEAGGETEQEEEQTPEETHELILLHQLLPDLLQSNRVKEAEDVVCRFLDRNPRNADGFALLAEVYSHQNMLAAACESLWGAVHNSPGNRMLLRLLHSTEEQFVLQQCQLPLSFLVKTLLVPRPPEDSASQDIHDSICSKEGAPVVVFRQGSHVTSLANRNLEPGDVVFRQRPFVLTPLILESGQIYTSCFHCLRSRNDPDTGFSCPISPHTCPFVFCSWQCLMRNSRIHAVECRAIPVLLAAAKEAQFSATTVLHLFRTLVKAGLERQSRMSAHQDKDMQRPPGDIVEQLLALNSYQAAVARGQPELYKQLVVLARRLQREFPEYMLLFLKEGELIDLILNIWQYSPLLTCPSVPSAAEGRNPDGAIGQVLAPAVSLLLHSCIPTCILCLEEDGQVAVKALTFIPIGGSLSISLEEDLYKSQRDRKHVMARPRVFGCGCIRCVDISEGGRLLRGIRCFSCVRGFLCPHKSRSLSSRLVAYSTASAASGLSKVSSLEYSRDPEAREEKAREKMISAGFNCIGAGFGTEREAGDPALVEEQWLCSSCGLDSTAASQRCRVLESEAEQQQAAAEKYLVTGAYIQARKEYTSLVRQYSTLLHPQHAVLFNAYTVLAGLLSSEPAADAPKALIFLRRAVLAAETVLPPTSRIKMDLYLKVAQLTYRAMQLNQHCRRGLSLPAAFIMGPMHVALWNCCVCFGSGSSIAIMLQQRLRRYAAVFSLCTPPLLFRPILSRFDAFVALYREVTNRQSISDQAISDHFASDPMFVAVALVRRGLCYPLCLEIFLALKDVSHFPTGLTLLGLACLYRQVDTVRQYVTGADQGDLRLLKMGFDVFHATALGVTPLLSLCGATRPSYDSRDSLETSYDAEGHFGVVCNAARKEAEILRLLLLHCDELDRRYFRRPKPVLLGGNAVEISSEPLGHEEHSQASRRGETQDVKCTRLESRTRLLNACTHWLLSSSFAVHFAASKGKTKLCRQLLAAGCSIDALNYESATALHIACIEGHLGTAGLLLDHGANIDATTHRGESPLLLGAYKLHKDVCALLLERGADPSLVTRTEKLSVLHAVAAGVTRQVSMTFKGASWDRDGVTAALAGLGSNSDGLGIHWKTNSYAAVEAEVDLRLPSATPDSLDLFFSPKIMISRTAKAQELLLVFIKYCPSQLYRQHSRNGFTPANLLQRMWDDFVAKRARLLQINSLQLAGQTEDEKADALGGWEFLSHRMIVLKDLLSARLAPFSPVSGVAEYSSTPRVEDLEKQQKEQLAADAPWLFQKLLSKRASPEKQSPQQTVLQGKEQGKQG